MMAFTPAQHLPDCDTDDHLVDHNSRTQTKIVLSRSRDHERCAHGLVRSCHQNYSRLLRAAVNKVPVNLYRAHVDLMIDSEVHAATKGHRKAGFTFEGSPGPREMLSGF